MAYAGSCGCRMSYNKDLYRCNGFRRGFKKFYSLIGFYDHWLGSMGVQGCGWGLICWKYLHLLEYHNGLPYFKASKVEVGCPSVSSNLYSNLHIECLSSSHLLYDLKKRTYDSMMSYDFSIFFHIFPYFSIVFPCVPVDCPVFSHAFPVDLPVAHPAGPGASWRSAAPPAA